MINIENKKKGNEYNIWNTENKIQEIKLVWR